MSTRGDEGPRNTTQIRSSRDPALVRAGLEAWLADQLPAGAAPAVTGLEGTSANGMSSETLLLDATWTEGGNPRAERLVARLAPDGADVPVFPAYDLERQFEVIRLVGERSDVPVPRTWWCEPDAGPIGTAFFVMSRLDGRVPPDVMPYNFGDSWLYDADPADQQRLQDATVDVLARLHAIDVDAGADDAFSFLAFAEPGATALRRRLRHTADWFDWISRDMPRSLLVTRAFAWLDEHFPADEGPAVVSWGDSRIGNVMYDGFEPAAVLDWEMAGLGPRELDLSWLAYAHRVFEDIAATYGMGGMPEFLRIEDVAGAYERITGDTPRHLEWYGAYAAVQYAIVFLRTGFRSVHFGEREMPAEVDELIMNRASLERMLAGADW
ncbi:MAG: phosphotransferase family protein [Acidimicrobiia bacterium]|nr:phosphotransferase family protein [Acidimicrobiia bacterium]